MLKVKKYVLWIACALILLSCNDSSNTNPPANNELPPNNVDVTGMSRDEALSMAKRNGCLACHSIEKKVVGPAWEDVSYRYKDDSSGFNTLVEKVKKGGVGAWGEVPMPPYSPRVSDLEIQQLVSFILGLDGGALREINLSVDSAAIALEQKQGERIKFSFYSTKDITRINNVNITMINGIVDISVEEFSGIQSPEVAKLTGIDGQAVIDNLPTGNFYHVYITARTDARYSISATLEPTKSEFIALAKISGCLACHLPDEKVVGPAWRDVSDRYKNDPDAQAILVEKVKNGGKGAWGQLPMPPYSPRVTDADISMLVSSILQLKGGSGILRLSVNASEPLELNLKQGKSVQLYFSSRVDPINTHTLDIIVSAGIVDVTIESVDELGTVNSAGELMGISDTGMINNLPTGLLYNVYVTAQTDAQFSISASVSVEGLDFLGLAEQSGCLACHSVDKKVVGPAWRDVSMKYINDPTAEARLTAKVKSGGKGIWGQTPMPPYSPRVSDEDITFLVKNILLIAQ